MRIARYFLPIVMVASLLGISRVSVAQVSKDFAVIASVTTQASPPQLTLAWPLDVNATGYRVSKRILGSGDDFTELATLDGSATEYIDTDVQTGLRYEYQLVKPFTIKGIQYLGYGYLVAGLSAKLVDKMGTVILIVDNTKSTPLAFELTRLQNDLIGDGWRVVRHDVSPSAKVTAVKAMIQSDYQADSNTHSVFLFGHVPVPYSGLLHPDAHPNHLGAWPADVYYGNLFGTWSDTDINDDTTQLANPLNRNISGDGKFDQSEPDVPMTLEVGRVDLSGMTSFPESDTELLRNYLNKDHNFRVGLLTAEQRGLVSDNFGAILGANDAEAFASDAWRAFPAFFGIANTYALNWFTNLDTATYLWAYGCGGGSFNSAGGIGLTSDFAKTGSKAIFTMLFGSYFGDWNVQDNFLRAPLCTQYGLCSAWAGRPHWLFHPFAMGMTLGYCALMTQDSSASYIPISFNGSINNYATDGEQQSFVSTALMGDPTLKIQYAAPMTSLTGAVEGTRHIRLTWQAPPDPEVEGYNVYRASSSAGEYTLINSSLLTSTNYLDTTARNDSDFYLVRAVEIMHTASGSYFEAGEGAMTTVLGVSGVAPLASATPATLNVTRVPEGFRVVVGNTEPTHGRLAVYDVVGREIAVLRDGTIMPNEAYNWDLRSTSGEAAASGAYIIRLTGTITPLTSKVMLTR